MNLLLDTHTLLWWWGEPHLLSPRVKAIIEHAEQSIFVSAASAWEIATKVRIGKLPNAIEAVEHFDEWLADEGFRPLPISQNHALKAGSLINQHRDPFDRMIAAQSILENLQVLTRDEAIHTMGATTLW